MKRYRTDVLVVGGGGAATASTIAAHEAGARTMLAVKGRFGVPGQRGAGATSNPLADFWTIRTVGPEGSFFNPPDAVYADMIQAGLGMADPELCRVFVDEVSGAVKRLRTMGMQFQSKMLATMEANPNAGKTNSRSEEHTSELQSQSNLVCRLLLEKKKTQKQHLLFAFLSPYDVLVDDNHTHNLHKNCG